VRQELIDSSTPFTRVPFLVIQDVFPYPENVGIFGAGGIVFDAQGIAVEIEEFTRFVPGRLLRDIHMTWRGSVPCDCLSARRLYNAEESLLYSTSLHNTPHGHILQQTLYKT